MPSNANWLSRLAWIVLAGGPPVLVLGLSPGLVTTHPTVAAVLVLLYEIVLGVFSFAGKVVRELEQRWIQRTADLFDRTIRRRLSGFGRHYRDYVILSQRHIDTKGLATIGFYTPELDEVFVDVSLARRAPSQVPTDLLASLPVKVTERLSIHEFLDRREQQRLAVVGAPGSGKTTCSGTPPAWCAAGAAGGPRTSRCCCTCATTWTTSSPTRWWACPNCSARPSGRCRRRNRRAGSTCNCGTAAASCCWTAWTRSPGSRTAAASPTGWNSSPGTTAATTT
jgi:hypothetical protein